MPKAFSKKQNYRSFTVFTLKPFLRFPPYNPELVNANLVLGSIHGPDDRHESSVNVGVEADIGGSVGASQAELGDEGDVCQDLGISRGVGAGLHLRVLTLGRS